MKAIFVESLDGYLAKGPEDRMLWTPSLDKQIFKLLSCAFGGVCICSNHTWELLPKSMKYCEFRKFIVAEKAGPYSLGNLNRIYPNAVLIGGPTFLKAAYNAKVIDTFINNEMKSNEDRINNTYKEIIVNSLYPKDLMFLKVDSLSILLFQDI